MIERPLAKSMSVRPVIVDELIDDLVPYLLEIVWFAYSSLAPAVLVRVLAPRIGFVVPPRTLQDDSKSTARPRSSAIGLRCLRAETLAFALFCAIGHVPAAMECAFASLVWKGQSLCQNKATEFALVAMVKVAKRRTKCRRLCTKVRRGT